MREELLQKTLKKAKKLLTSLESCGKITKLLSETENKSFEKKLKKFLTSLDEDGKINGLSKTAAKNHDN